MPLYILIPRAQVHDLIPLGTGFPGKEFSLVAVGKLKKKKKSPEKTVW